VDCAWFKPAPADAAVRARLGWGGRPVLLTVARLQARKGHLRLLEALPALVARHPDLLWAVIGEGRLRRELEDRSVAADLEANVLIHGEVDEETLLAAYQQCDVFVLPNVEVDGDFEGFGMVLLEAQACGRAVVAGRSGGTAEAMVEDETGLLVDCASGAALGGALQRLLEAPELRRAMGERGRRWASSFDWDAIAVGAVEIWDRFGV
jgi:phosphatidylinositol alpha-1,6-mannosyltransferase